jgi:CheY-like chemotaxis protein
MYKKVMLIDDSDMNLFITRSLIRQTGFAIEVRVKKSADNALEYLRRFAQTPSELPEIIFLDINMPGMNGFHFLEQFGKLNTATRTKCQIIMLSSASDISGIQRAIGNIYVNRYIEKPLDALKLFDIRHGNHALVAA